MKFLGVDIGGTNTDVVLLDRAFKYIATYPTSDYFENLSELLEKLVGELNIGAIGISAALWLKKGEPIYAPNLPSIKIEKDVGVPVFLENDANCFAIFAHEVFRTSNILAITIGTGIGSGIIANGKIYRGEGIAGEIGHWSVGRGKRCTCGGRGHLESYFSGWSLKKRYKKEVKELMKDENFIYSIESFNVFCKSVANAILLLDPATVVFGGRIGMQLDEEKLRDEIYKYLMPGFLPEIKILRDELAAAKGACLMAQQKMKS